MFTIGILFPRSALYPSIGFDVVEGFSAGLSRFWPEEVRLIKDSVGIGGLGNDVYQKAEKMLVNESVDILVAYLDHFAAEKIQPLADAANRLLVVIDPGATVPTSWKAAPLRFHLSLDAAFGSRLLGGVAYANGGQKALFATSFYDGGYLSCSALIAGYQARGGCVAHNYVAPFRFEDFDVSVLARAIEETRPDVVLSQLCMDMGALFLKSYREAGLAEKAPFFASPFLLEETFLDTLPFPFAGITGIIPWFRMLDNEANQEFKDAMSDNYGRPVNCFSALAWDAAHFTALALEALKTNKRNARLAATALEDCSFEGTRGLMRLDKQTHYFTAPLYHATLLPSESGCSKLAVGGPVKDLGSEWTGFTAEVTSGVFSCWTNTFLCTT